MQEESKKTSIREVLDELEPQKVYDLKEVKQMFENFGLKSQIFDSLYYFDIDYRINVVRGIHIIQQLKEVLGKEVGESQ